MTDLERAILFATEAHADQVDGCGQPYILHCLSVMLRVARGGHPEYLQVAAVLHDVIEDCGTYALGLRQRFSPGIFVLVEQLSRRDGETYEDYIERIARNPSATIIKLADLEDHFDARRAAGLKPEMRQRYERARARLSNGRRG